MGLTLIECRVGGCEVMFAGATDESREQFRERHEDVVHKRRFPREAKGEKVTVQGEIPILSGYKPTSYAAWLASLPKLGEVQRGILDLYHRCGALTDEELYDAYTADKPAYRNTVLPARTGLAKIGYVVDTGQKRAVRSGRSAIVWGLPI
jgi:hypothetical protein